MVQVNIFSPSLLFSNSIYLIIKQQLKIKKILSWRLSIAKYNEFRDISSFLFRIYFICKKHWQKTEKKNNFV